MWEGAERVKHEVVLFLDADLIHLTPQHVNDLVRPVLAEEADMAVGQFMSGSPLVTAWMRFCPGISGQRAMRVADFLSIPEVSSSRYGVEVVITRAALSAATASATSLSRTSPMCGKNPSGACCVGSACGW